MAFLKFVFIFYATVAMSTLLVNAFSTKKDMCTDGQAPLAGYFCGRGINRRECPSTHHCVIAPNDAYAVCCPNHEERASKVVIRSADEKPGSCPPPKVSFGICIAKCSADADCPNDEKCCGSCPRACVKAVSTEETSL